MSALGTRHLQLDIDGDEVTAEISDCRVESAKSESDFTTFLDAHNGGALDWFLRGVGVQDLATGTLWRKVWASAGTSVAAIVRPYGNAVPSTSQPHYEGNVTIKVPEGVVIGGEANSSNSARFTFEIDFQFDEKPTEITAP